MAVAVTCPCCNGTLRISESFAGYKVRCPHCKEKVSIPAQAEDSAFGEPPDPFGQDVIEPLPLSARFGIASLTLGLVSVMVLCVPFVGYAAFGLSSLGVLLGLCGLFMKRPKKLAGRDGAKQAAVGAELVGPVNYPLAGIAACLIAFMLALLPFLIH